jgi:hypothetical protein
MMMMWPKSCTKRLLRVEQSDHAEILNGG